MVVAPRDDEALLCEACQVRMAAEELDGAQWHCLQESAWSEVPAVQVLAWRLLARLSAEGWASDLIDQLYLDDDVMSWAEAGLADDRGEQVLDANGAVLEAGDSVSIIKDLDVKGTSFVAKRGTTVKNIRITNDPSHVEGKVNGTSIMLKTCFLKKL